MTDELLATKAMREFARAVKNGTLKPGYWQNQVTACLRTIQAAVHFRVHETDMWDALEAIPKEVRGVDGVICAPYKNFTVQVDNDPNSGDVTMLFVCSVNNSVRPDSPTPGKDYLYVWRISEPPDTHKHLAPMWVDRVCCADIGSAFRERAYPPPEFYEPRFVKAGASVDIYESGCAYGQMILALFFELYNAHTEAVIQQASPKNNRRILDGKLPIWEVKTLVLKTPVTRTVSEYQGGTHASPRQHIRRGHYRHYKSGKIAWVRDCIVGSLEKGFVHKDYRVEPAAA